MQIENRILLTVKDRVARVQLNRPDKRNALDLEMFRAIAEVQKKLRKERDVRAVVLTGSGGDFCTGLDIKSMINDRMGILKLLWKWLPRRANLAQQVSVGWRELSVPVFAAVRSQPPRCDSRCTAGDQPPEMPMQAQCNTRSGRT